MPASNAVAELAARTPAARAHENRFAKLTPACLSRSEKSSVISLALKVLSGRFRRGRSLNPPDEVRRFLRLKLSGRRNEVFGVVNLDTRRPDPDGRTLPGHHRRGVGLPACRATRL